MLYKKYMKRVLDSVLALCLIFIALPVIIGTAILVYFKVGRPILFTQNRPGKDEEIFKIYKFRTMTDERDASDILLSDEIRLTTLGGWLRKLSLDELPQLFNVLRGEMSFVGPRPLLEEYLILYNNEQRKRQDVLPGITGWAQVNGRNTITWKQKFEYDIWYVENQSFFLDMKIVWMTFLKVLQQEGISSESSVTMEKFEGTKQNAE